MTSQHTAGDELERILRFNCPQGCDGKGTYPEWDSDGEPEQGQCQWCLEYGMPAREAIETVKKLAYVQGGIDEIGRHFETVGNNQLNVVFRTRGHVKRYSYTTDERNSYDDRIKELQAQKGEK